jgi:hypothetical protein
MSIANLRSRPATQRGNGDWNLDSTTAYANAAFAIHPGTGWLTAVRRQ